MQASLVRSLLFPDTVHTSLSIFIQAHCLAVFQNNEPASLMDIRKYWHDKTGKDWALASLYIALDKLKKT